MFVCLFVSFNLFADSPQITDLVIGESCKMVKNKTATDVQNV